MTTAHVLKTLDRSLYILTLFDTQQPEWGVTELSRRLDLPKSVVQKTLATFARRGFLYQDDVSRRYRLGPRILSLARLAEPELARIAKPHMMQLAEATRETAKLTVVDGAEAVIVAAVESPQSLRMTGRVGERNALYAGASNKLLAAHMGWTNVETALRLHWTDANDIQGRIASFRRELEAIAAAGYAVSIGEREPGVKAISVPVHGHGDKTLASLSIVGPGERMNATGDDRLLNVLRQTSATISRALGYDASLDGEGSDAEANSALSKRTS